MPRTRRDPKSQRILVVTVFVGIVATVLGVSFMLMTQATNRENYVITIQNVSDEARVLTRTYEDSIAKWENGLTSKEQILQITDSHLENLNRLLTKLKSLEPPEKFLDAHELSILSLDHELQSDQHMRSYIETGKEEEREMSATLLQKAFDYEAEAFEEFSRASKST
jgi:hypothetical protein